MTTKYYQKTKKGFGKKHIKDIIIFLKKEKTKSVKMPTKDIKFFWRRKENKRQYYREHNKNLSKDQKERLIEYRRNYHITHNK